MKSITYSIISLSLLLLVSGCNDIEDLFKSTGPLTTEERSLPFIDGIYLGSNVDLVVHYDSVFHMQVTAGSHLLEKIVTNTEGNILHIKNENRFNWVRKFDPTLVVDIWVPTLKSIYVENASGNISFADTLVADRFDFNSFGSIGVFDVTLKCRETYLKMHTGPSDMKVHGKTDFNYIYNAGGGNFDCLDYSTNVSDVTNKGFNDVSLKVSVDFYVRLESIGNIYYKGSPVILKLIDNGDGEIIHL